MRPGSRQILLKEDIRRLVVFALTRSCADDGHVDDCVDRHDAARGHARPDDARRAVRGLAFPVLSTWSDA